MSKARQPSMWAVYLIFVPGKLAGGSAVCEQGEWDEMDRQRPGCFTLVRAGIASEPEAEALAREASGYVAPAPKLRPYKLARKPAKG